MKKRHTLLIIFFLSSFIAVAFIKKSDKLIIREFQHSPKTTSTQEAWLVSFPNIIPTPKTSIALDEGKTGTISTDWKTYNNIKHRFSFQYPNNWTQNGVDADIVDLSGNIKAIEINFKDALSGNTQMTVDYYFAPSGAEVYQYAATLYNSSKEIFANEHEQIKVAGLEALKAFSTITQNGKGNAINPPLRVIVVYFLDKAQTGSMELQFTTPLLNDQKEVANFNHVLKTFAYNN